MLLKRETLHQEIACRSYIIYAMRCSEDGFFLQLSTFCFSCLTDKEDFPTQPLYSQRQCEMWERPVYISVNTYIFLFPFSSFIFIFIFRLYISKATDLWECSVYVSVTGQTRLCLTAVSQLLEEPKQTQPQKCKNQICLEG